MDYMTMVQPWQKQRISLLTSTSRSVLGLMKPPIQWVPEVLSPMIKCGWGVTLTTHPHPSAAKVKN
jgi:hypothetical protein